MQIYEFFGKFKKELENADSAETKKYAFLKYHQNMTRAFATNILIDTRGLLIYHTMGMGKSIMGVALAFELMENTATEVIVLLTKSLQENFRKGIHKYINLRAAADPDWKYAKMSAEEVQRVIEQKFSFVSMNASNMISQLSKAALGDLLPNKRGVSPPHIKSLNGKCLIVDEAHNLFRAITNGSQNAKALYDIIMESPNVKLVFLTGTPISNDPFELVPCFNMLAGKVVFPEIWRDFYRSFVDAGQNRIKNKGKFQNRILGLVSYVTHTLLKGTAKFDVEFPEELPTIIEYVPMEPTQYVLYQLAREREKEEAKRGNQNPFAQAPIMQKPKSNVSSSYRQKSRQISNFCPASYGEADLNRLEDIGSDSPDVQNTTFIRQKYSEIDVNKIPDDQIKSAKYDAILKNINASEGNGYVYSQFVGAGGIGSFRRYLEKHGWELCDYQKNLEKNLEKNATDKSKQRGETSPKTIELNQIIEETYPVSQDNPIEHEVEKAAEEIQEEMMNEPPEPIAAQEMEEEKIGGNYISLEKIGGNYISLGKMHNIENRLFNAADERDNEIISNHLQRLTTEIVFGGYVARGKRLGKNNVQDEHFVKGMQPRNNQFDNLPQNTRLHQNVHSRQNTHIPRTKHRNTKHIVRKITIKDIESKEGIFEQAVNSLKINCTDPSIVEKTIYNNTVGYAAYINNIPVTCVLADVQKDDIFILFAGGNNKYLQELINNLNVFYKKDEREYVHGRESILMDSGFRNLGEIYQLPLSEPLDIAVDESAKNVTEDESAKNENVTFTAEDETAKQGGSNTPNVSQIKKSENRKRKFAVITGEVNVEDRQALENIIGSEQNKNGGIIDLVLVSSTGAEGLDFKNMRHAHIMESYWNYARTLQVGARGNRNDSHKALAPNQRNIRMFIYLAVKPAEETNNMTKIAYDKLLKEAIGGKPSVIDEYMTTDLELYIKSITDYKLIESFLTALQEASIECAAYHGENAPQHCRMCDPNNTMLYYDDIDQDLKATDPCIRMTEKKVTADEIEYKGEKFYYIVDDASIFGYAVFLFDEKIGKHIRMEEDDPRFIEIVKLLKK